MRAGAEGTATLLALDPRDRPLYTLREAARYLGVPEATLRAWVRGRSYPVRGGQGWGWSGPLIATPEGGPLLSFHNLVEANVLVALRKEHRITMGKVRQMVAYARERLGVARPLPPGVRCHSLVGSGVACPREMHGRTCRAGSGMTRGWVGTG
ncbi:helix-turn-helix domain-containing protein [Thermus tengchongensis]|uniref:helix-turn-helix domain-containing protein n=1 Tax=Thermus tengchongensis TaxID=1214928 RepID=UPI0030B8E32C